MKQHGLHQWTFKFDNARSRFGCCKHSTKTISLSRILTELNDEENVKDTILHEIAHALAGRKAGHSYRWKMVAENIGCSPSRTYDSEEVVTPRSKYTGICPNCDRKTQRDRRRKNLACGECCRKFNNGLHSKDYIFIWQVNQ